VSVSVLDANDYIMISSSTKIKQKIVLDEGDE